MLSGYWPVVGTGVAVFSAEGELTLLVPEDEEEMARRSWAATVLTFQSSSLDNLKTTAEAISGPLSKLIGGYKRIGFENGDVSEPASYIAMHLYSGARQKWRAMLLYAERTLCGQGLRRHKRPPRSTRP